MILADTSAWIDHLRGRHPRMLEELGNGQIVLHSHVVGELALGGVLRSSLAGQSLAQLRFALSATDEEVMLLIETQQLAGSGIGYVDAHLLAATLLTPGLKLLTLDRSLFKVAERLGIAA